MVKKLNPVNILNQTKLQEVEEELKWYVRVMYFPLGDVY